MGKSKSRSKFSKLGAFLVFMGINIILWGISVADTGKKTLPQIERDMVVLSDLTVRPENEGKLVLLSGKLSVREEYLKDEAFEIAVDNSGRLERTVYMLQWEEKRHTVGNKDNYTYSRVWTPRIIYSANFKFSGHGNPKTKPIEDKVFTAPMYLGDFVLTDEQAEKVPDNTKLTGLDEKLGLEYGLTVVDNAYTNVKGGESKIGDIKIRFTCVDLDTMEDVTVLAIQTGNTFSKYHIENYGDIDKIWLKPLNKDEVMVELKSDTDYAWIGGVFLGLFFLIPGIYKLWAKRRDVEVDELLERRKENKKSSSAAVVMGVENSFLMPIDDVFSLSNGRTIVVGKVERGAIAVGDALEIAGGASTVKTACQAMERGLNTQIDKAGVGDKIAVLLRDVKKEEVHPGQSLTAAR